MAKSNGRVLRHIGIWVLAVAGILGAVTECLIHPPTLTLTLPLLPPHRPVSPPPPSARQHTYTSPPPCSRPPTLVQHPRPLDSPSTHTPLTLGTEARRCAWCQRALPIPIAPARRHSTIALQDSPGKRALGARRQAVGCKQRAVGGARDERGREGSHQALHYQDHDEVKVESLRLTFQL